MFASSKCGTVIIVDYKLKFLFILLIMNKLQVEVFTLLLTSKLQKLIIHRNLCAAHFFFTAIFLWRKIDDCSCQRKFYNSTSVQLVTFRLCLQEENKEIALGTSKLNYLDPRISVAWCKKWDVPIEKIYNKTQRDKFAWTIEMADEDFQF